MLASCPPCTLPRCEIAFHWSPASDTANVAAARQRDRTGVMRVLGSLAGAEGQRAYQDPFLHTLVGHLALMADDFAQEDFCTVVFDEFFLSGLSGTAPASGASATLPTSEVCTRDPFSTTTSTAPAMCRAASKQHTILSCAIHGRNLVLVSRVVRPVR